MNAKSLCQELVCLVEEETPVAELYPLLRELGGLLPPSLADSLTMRLDEQSQEFVLETKHPFPLLDKRHFARWNVWESLTDADDAELRDHIGKVVRAILREIERLDAPTVTTAKACKILGIARSTLLRWAKEAGIESVRRGHWLRSDIERLK